MSGDELITLLQPTIERLGFELSDLELKSGGGGQLLRVFIDKPEGITVDDCAEASHQIGALLDVEDTIPGHYVLEVSSPGLNRRLRTAEHYRRFVGEAVKIELRFPVAGRRRFRGKLRAADDENIELDVDGESHSLPMSTIELARLVPAL